MGRKGKKWRMQNGKMTEVSRGSNVTNLPTTSTHVGTTQRTTENKATDFKIFIPREVYMKIMHWVDKADYEVSGFGCCEFNEEHKFFFISDAILLKQKVGPSSTEIDPHAIGKAMYLFRDKPGALKWHWHSHVNMGVFWSGDDMEIIRSYGQQDWILASVFNKKREVRSAFYTTTKVMGMPHDIFVDQIETKVHDRLAPEIRAQLDAEYDANVELERPFANYSGGYYGGYTSTHTPAVTPAQRYAPGDDLPPVNHERVDNEESFYTSHNEKPLDLTYDAGGYAWYSGNWWYNPVYDQDLTDDDERALFIGEMQEEEIVFMEENCYKFRKLLSRYITLKAGEKEALENEQPILVT